MLCNASNEWTAETMLRKYPPYRYIDRASIIGLTVFRVFFLSEKLEIILNREEKDRQIRKEARATLILFFICFLWNVGFAYGLSGTGIRILGLPLWWIISTPGMFLIAIIGVFFILKKVFVDFDFDDDQTE